LYWNKELLLVSAQYVPTPQYRTNCFRDPSSPSYPVVNRTGDWAALYWDDRMEFLCTVLICIVVIQLFKLNNVKPIHLRLHPCLPRYEDHGFVQ